MQTNIKTVTSEALAGASRSSKHNITQDIVLLGLLAEGPMHGYEVRKAIEERLGPLMGIRPRSIYYSLDKLEKRELLQSESAREGKRPRKFIYSLTEKGRRELEKLLIQNILVLHRPYFDIDLSLYFFEHADRNAFEEALRERLASLQSLASRDDVSVIVGWERKNEEAIRKIAAHTRRHLNEEIKFTKKLLRELRQPAPERV